MNSFNEAYRGSPPWDIGRPQREFVRLADRNEIAGDVIDVCCGTGEHAIFLASRGNRVLGVDSSPLAIEKARAKATQRNSKAEFTIADALDLSQIRRVFDTALDSGLFHVFPDPERARYVMSLGSVLRPGGRYFMLVFSDKEPTAWGGPRRVSRQEIIDSFANGWQVDYVRPAKFESKFHADGGAAWLARITKRS
jgi:SAM-dependent methyltransferase